MPSAENASADTSLEELTEGRKLYIEHCGNCHLLYKPLEFTKEQWKTEVNEMQKEAKIDDRTKDLILKYLWNAPGSLTSGLSDERKH